MGTNSSHLIHRGRGAASRAFTLVEVMLAVVILGLLVTAVSVSLRSKWQAEQSRRVAQQMVVTWMKTHSKAWRDGVEWVVTVDETNSVIAANPVASTEIQKDSDREGNSSSPIFLQFDKKVIVAPEGREELKPVHFYPDGRASQSSVLVIGPDGNAWRVKTDWTGQPSMEKAVTPPKYKKF